MATIKRFEEIEAWKRGRLLCAAIYRLTKNAAFHQDYNLRNQMRRAAVSIGANVAEGFGRHGSTEFRQFLAHAKGSATELQAHLYFALDADYIDQPTFDALYRQADEVQRLLRGFIKYLATSNVRGSKYIHEPQTPDPRLQT